MIFQKELSAYVCVSCSYVRYVNPVNRKEMTPGI